MPQAIEIKNIKTQLDSFFDEVGEQKRSYIVKRAKKPIAAVMPIEIYRSLLEVPDEEVELYTNERLKEFLDLDQKF